LEPVLRYDGAHARINGGATKDRMSLIVRRIDEHDQHCLVVVWVFLCIMHCVCIHGRAPLALQQQNWRSMPHLRGMAHVREDGEQNLQCVSVIARAGGAAQHYSLAARYLYEVSTGSTLMGGGSLALVEDKADVRCPHAQQDCEERTRGVLPGVQTHPLKLTALPSAIQVFLSPLHWTDTHGWPSCSHCCPTSSPHVHQS
jgi:hypothetical protein